MPTRRGTGTPARSRPCRPMRAGGQPALGRGDRPGHGALADQLEAALAHRWLIEQAKGVIMGRERLDAQAAFERLRGAARSSTRRLADVARDVTDGPAPAGQPADAGQGPGPDRPGSRRAAPNDRTDRPGPPLRRPLQPLPSGRRRRRPILGDYPVFHDILLRDGEEVGDEGGTCPIVDVEQGLIHCTGTMRLPGGQLTFQGLTTTAPTKQLAITAAPAATRAWAGKRPWSSWATGPAPSGSGCAARFGDRGKFVGGRQPSDEHATPRLRQAKL